MKINCKKFVFKIEVPFISNIIELLNSQKHKENFLRVKEERFFTSSIFILDF